MTVRSRATRITTASALIAAVLAAAVLSVAGPARADDVTLTDPADASGSLSDIREVTVRHAAARLRVGIGFTELRPTSEAGPSGVSIYVDTDRSRRGPEYLLASGLQSGTDYQLVRTRGWGDTIGDPLSCAHRVRLDFAANRLRGWIARRCLRFPEQVRVAVRMTDNFDASHPITDWLKGPRRWTRALGVG
jgi:hypothetical protein